MAIDFGTGIRALQAYGEEASRDQQMQLAQQRSQQQAYTFNQGVQQDQARPQIIQQARGGNFQGAADAALGGGDFDLAKAIGGMREDQLQQFQHQADVVGTLTPQLKSLAPELRAAAGARVLSQAGFTPEQLARMDWSDEGLDAQYQLSAAGKAAVAARLKAQNEAYTLNPGDRRYVGTQQVAENPKPNNPDYIFDSESGSWLMKPGSGTGPAALAQPGYAGSGGAPLSAGPAQRDMAASLGGIGLPAPVVAGFMGNFHAEGGYTGAQGDGGSAGGVAQWRGERRANFQRVIGKDPTRASMQEQAAFVKWEMDNPQAAGMTVGQRDAILRSRSPEEAAALIDRHYERSSGVHRGRRVDAARQFAGGAQQPTQDLPGVINVRPPRQKQENAPSGYRFNGGRLEPIPGGPADPATSTNRSVQSNRKAEGEMRSKFDQLPQVKTFNAARQQFNTLRNLASKPNTTGSDDLAIIFNFMKTLDPASVVREGEFQQAANSAGIIEAVGNKFQRAENGKWLSDEQRKNMVKTAYVNYKNYRDAYNQAAEQHRGYARDYGLSPDRVARTYTPDKPTPKPAGNRMSQFKIVKVN
jgi:hypothetical protein